MIGYLDEIIRTSVLILPKLSGYVKFSKKEGDKNKNNDNNWTFFRIDIDKLLEKYKTSWYIIKDLQKYWIERFTTLWW